MEKNVSPQELARIANTNRKRAVEMVYQAGVGHIGGSLSVMDMLTAIYETDVDFSSEQRSRVVLSKGHVTPALYAELTQKGIISEDEYPTFRQLNSRLQGHPYTVDIPEVDASTGLLGQGFSIASGMAVAKRVNGDNHRVYAICGDGEAQEGQIWEALMFAAHNKLDNLTFVFDVNGLSSHCPANDNINMNPLADKLVAFNLHVIEIDGHDMEAVVAALDEAKATKGQPSVIISHTIKGKGVSFMENNPAWHSKGLTNEEYQTAMNDLSGKEGDLA